MVGAQALRLVTVTVNLKRKKKAHILSRTHASYFAGFKSKNSPRPAKTIRLELVRFGFISLVK